MRVALVAPILLVFAARAGIAHAEDTFGLAVAIASVDGAPVQSDAWVDAQIAEANRLYVPLGIRLRWSMQKPLAARFSALESRRDRDALAPETEPRVISVFVVSSLRDVDDPSLHRMGVTWRPSPGSTYIILAATARPTVLAHELGHYFGNGHSTVVNNLMSYARSDGDVFLDAKQAAIVKWTAQDLVRRGVLVPLPVSRVLP
jgi:hypothetical protein